MNNDNKDLAKLNTTNNALTSEDELLKQKEYLNKVIELTKKYEELIGHKPTCDVVTFGCQMNARDSEKLIGILLSAGFEAIDDENADIVIYNTCTVRDNANQRVYGRLGALHSMKKKNPNKLIGLCGCMMQEESVIEKIKESYSFVDLIFGTHNIYKFSELLYILLDSRLNTDLSKVKAKDRIIIDIWKETDRIVEELPVSRKYSFKSGINIMFGCNNFCTYCIVPYVRGRERSRKPDEIIKEIEMLVKDGVVEIMLLGQNVNSYGKNLDEEITFAKLLQRVEKIEGLKRIRFMTSHPKDLSDELIEVMKNSSKICRHMHLPAQSGSTRILEKMNRRYTREKYISVVNKLKAAMPDISLTTDLIVGFPGETKEDALETASLVKEVGFDNAFTFIYSPRTGTPAASMEQCNEDEVKENFDMVLKTVQETAKIRVARFEGMVMDCLVEEVNDHDSSYLTGRLSNNILVHFKGNEDLIGSIVSVKLVENKGFYYIGEINDIK